MNIDVSFETFGTQFVLYGVLFLSLPPASGNIMEVNRRCDRRNFICPCQDPRCKLVWPICTDLIDRGDLTLYVYSCPTP